MCGILAHKEVGVKGYQVYEGKVYISLARKYLKLPCIYFKRVF